MPFRAVACNRGVAPRLLNDTMTPWGREPTMRIRLTRKLANLLNGVDLTHCRVGNILDVHPSVGQMLVAEEWAEPVEQKRDTAADRSPRRAGE